MADVSELAEKEEPPEEKNDNAAAVLAAGGEEPPELEEEGPPEDPVDVPWPAAVAERYERREKLGEGMFGEVYKAWDRVLERDVAVKRLSGRTDERFVAAPLPYFAREVTSLEACRGHPAIVHILAMYADYGRADGDRFIITEYAGPKNLREHMREHRRRLDEGEVRDVMAQLLAGAAHAHKAGVLHRDIVPENVIVDVDAESGRMVCKIGGFGVSEPAVAQAEERDDFGHVASPGPYRAPELFLESKEYDDRVDTWSLGCIMAELVAGDGVPFFSAPDGEVFSKLKDVVGTKGIVMWNGFKRVPPREKVKIMGRASKESGNLRKKFPPQMLSRAAFKVLKGLLHSNPDRRLSAADALRMPWFQSGRTTCCFMLHGGGVGVAP